MEGQAPAQFRGEKYLNLETFRRNGQGVRTPLWFVETNGVLYVRTPDDTGKLKRIRKNSRARVAPSTATGRPKGEWLEAKARFAEPGEATRANELLNRKYGWMKRLIDLGTWLRRRGHVVIAIEV
jgi:uncharacterized protein